LEHEGHEDHEGIQRDARVSIVTLRVTPMPAVLALIDLFFFVFLRVSSCARGELLFPG
jgi:hypothetical protein